LRIPSALHGPTWRANAAIRESAAAAKKHAAAIPPNKKLTEIKSRRRWRDGIQ
jgi:hypothetical protein